MRGTEFAELSAFAAIAERASFAKAAAHLGVSASALSQSIRLLEERLGVRLLNRTTRSVSTTAAGERLLDQLRPALEGLARATDAINDFRETPTGVVRLTVPRVAADLLLVPRLAEFRARYPAITLDLAVEDKVTDIVKHRFDAGIRRGEMLDQDMVARRISPDRRFVAAAAPGYLASRGYPLMPRDLQSHDCICIRRPSSGAIAPWRFMENGQFLDVKVGGPLILSDAHVALGAALNGAGIVLLAEDHLQPYLDDGRLLPLLDAWCWARPGFFLYYPSQRQLSPALQALAEFLRPPFI
ncbi:LysR family transcriptional regulator [Paraherbaspirillum soli]|uniref:LysR family transcriptional regulator n=1 Tax=Paraherbaspirillum soli TaxID=631222 RepID=A0ABW0MBL3_9BURK